MFFLLFPLRFFLCCFFRCSFFPCYLGSKCRSVAVDICVSLNVFTGKKRNKASHTSHSSQVLNHSSHLMILSPFLLHVPVPELCLCLSDSLSSSCLSQPKTFLLSIVYCTNHILCPTRRIWIHTHTHTFRLRRTKC